MGLFESATVLRADHAAQALPGGSKLVLKFSHAELSTSSIGIASVPFGYKAAVDGFELGDAGDELERVVGPRFRHRVEAAAAAAACRCRLGAA